MLTEQKSQSTTDVNSEQLQSNGGTNANQKDNSNYSRNQIEKTPFSLIKTMDGENIIVLGEHRLSEIHETEEEAIEYMETWNFKCNVIAAMINITTNLKETQNG